MSKIVLILQIRTLNAKVNRVVKEERIDKPPERNLFAGEFAECRYPTRSVKRKQHLESDKLLPFKKRVGPRLMFK